MKIPPQEHFLRMAWMIALNLSKDPNTKVGAVITTPDYRQISMGYNGFPRGIKEDYDRWQPPVKYEYSIHAEQNCVINCPFDKKGCILFVTLEPCHKCLGLLINAGISQVWFSDFWKNGDREKINELRGYFDFYSRWEVNPEFLISLKNLY